MNNRFSSRLLWLVLVIIAASALLAGCGQNGPLYLPDDTGEQEQETR